MNLAIIGTVEVSTQEPFGDSNAGFETCLFKKEGFLDADSHVINSHMSAQEAREFHEKVARLPEEKLLKIIKEKLCFVDVSDSLL